MSVKPSVKTTARPLSVYVVCSGLGNINRGFESFTQECFDALAEAPGIDLRLFKGGGQNLPRQNRLWNIPRESTLASRLGKIVHKSGYFVEQITFSLSLLSQIMKFHPDVIYFSDCNVGNVLWHWRRLRGGNYKLLFSNGGPLSPPFPRWDYVQQVAPSHLEAALVAGQAPERQSLVPYGISMDDNLAILSPQERRDLRNELDLPVDRPIILSVGAINSTHKRMDYVISETASVTNAKPYLLMLGQQEEEADTIRDLADRLLGQGNYRIQTVQHAEIKRYYQAADMFVLASLNEGFGRVFLEALSYGLPCLAHNYDLTRYIFQDNRYLNNMRKPGSLKVLIHLAIQEGDTEVARRQRHQRCHERFSWNCLSSEYIAMIRECAHDEFLREAGAERIASAAETGRLLSSKKHR